MNRGWHPCDIPYGCFLLAGATSLAMGLIRASYTDAEWSGGAGAIFLLILPVILAAFVAMLVGIVLTVWLWREWPLPLLAALSIVAILGSLVGIIPARIENAVPTIYGAVTCAICAVWFLFSRWRQLRGLPPAHRPA